MLSPYHPFTLFAFTGRIGRLQYLVGNLYLLAIGLIVGFAVGGSALVGGGRANADLAEAAAKLVVLVPSLGLMVQRMRDFGLKWWWLLVIYGGLFVSAVFSMAMWNHPLRVVFTIMAIVGVCCMLGLAIALFFMPGKPGDKRNISDRSESDKQTFKRLLEKQR